MRKSNGKDPTGVHQILRGIFALFFVVGAIISLILFWTNAGAHGGILLAWVLGPPVIFWLEYFCFAPLPDTEDKKVQLARLNDFRAVSQAIWAGVGAALGALYLHKP
jgi:hypothetical protein